MVESDPVNFLTDAGKLLLSAASIMQFLHTQIDSGVWNRSYSTKFPNPNDINAKVCLCLSLLFKASAQAMAVTKALNTETTPSGIKARLAISVMNTTRLSLDAIQHLPNAINLYQYFMSHIAITRELYSAIAYLFLAQSNSEKTEMGLAIAYCGAAKVETCYIFILILLCVDSVFLHM